MGFFHKISVGIDRWVKGKSIPDISEEKSYGNEGEDIIVGALRKNLSDAQIKTNVIVYLPGDGSEAEIDCLVMYKNNLFAIEVKRWKGDLFEENDSIISHKKDKYSDKVHKDIKRSPFKQLKRAISLLRKSTNSGAWIEPIVYFEGAGRIEISKDKTWFSSINELIKYIKEYYNPKIQTSRAVECFKKSLEADRLHSKNLFGKKSCKCSIDSGFFSNNDFVPYRKRDINAIYIKHHIFSDSLTVFLKNGEIKEHIIENGIITAYHDKKTHKYNLSKLDYIYVGK